MRSGPRCGEATGNDGANTYTGTTSINAGVLNVQPQGQSQGAPPPDTELTVAFRHRNAVTTPATLSFKARQPQVNVEVLTLVGGQEQVAAPTWTRRLTSPPRAPNASCSPCPSPWRMTSASWTPA